jgi:predicted MPP superfamily phosphohydrolase
VTRVRLALPNLPEYWQGKTAVMVSDLHLGHVLREGFARALISRINGLHPEVVFIPGDFFDGVHTTFKELAGLFKEVVAPHGIYYVSGNHEQIAGMRICESALEETGIRVLENEKADIEGLQIVGTAYRSGETPDALRQILAGIGIARERPSIYLKHIPDHLDIAADAGIDLQLSGHTHLGQLWPFRYITRRLFGSFDYGLHYFKNMAVYTSSGVGTWGPPMRVFTKAEIVVFTFINRV